ncbi:MAG: sugar phosphate isomerase/epimerase [Marivita sp.]|uniref:sugar phosphate isomerase/epimerase family protein n=1 Tax=Marivita sp. TaxID=2003365 RepID=UPI0025BD28AC|nr:TIM barrel protein [Marivita sp.]MCI5109442.1 sugar phosphate isomerase/epimerase [Marivita sp.]
MSRIYSMAYLTANGLPPVEAVTLAARLGFDRISFRLLPAGPGDTPPPLLSDDHLVREVMAALADTGLTMADAEMIRLDADPDLDRFRPFLARCAQMGARHVLVAGDDKDRSRIIDTYGRLCELTWDYGLTADLEFMPWTGIRNIADARELVEAAAHPAAAILFDCLHFDRSDSTLEDIASVPSDMFNYVQICDGPVPYDPDGTAMMVLGRTARLIPGDGGIDIPAIIARLPKQVPVSVEVPNVDIASKVGVAHLVKRALEATKAMMGDA